MSKLTEKAIIGLFIGFAVAGSALIAGTIVQPWILQSYNGIPGQIGQDSNGNVTVTGQSLIVNAPVAPLVTSTATLAGLTPNTTGQLVIVTGQASWNVGSPGVCISSGILPGAWIQVSSVTAVTQCK